MNKIVSIKDTSAIFLAIVLVTGIVALSSQSFKTANALSSPLFTEENKYESTGYQPENVGQKSNSYESTKYEMDRYEKSSYRNDNYHQQPEYSTYTHDYEPQYSSYGKDSNSYYKSKDSSSAFVKKINCNNINVNLNGLDIDATAASGNGDTNDGAVEAASLMENGNGNNGGYGERNNNYAQRGNDFKFVCINNNNNTIVVVNETIPEPPEPETCEECFTTILTEEELNDLIQGTVLFNTLDDLCNFIDTNFENESDRLFISQYLFNAANEVGLSEKITTILDCLEEIYGVNFPRP